MPTTTGKKLRYVEIIAFATTPSIFSAFRTTIIIGARARIGMVWDAITHGMTDMSIARLWTMPTASRMPRPAPKMNPRKVALNVIQVW